MSKFVEDLITTKSLTSKEGGFALLTKTGSSLALIKGIVGMFTQLS